MKIDIPKIHQDFFDAGGNPDAKRRGTRGRKNIGETVGIILALLFSFFLMFYTFSYSSSTQEIRVATKLWSDFGAHIPLIRSFSYGQNYTRLMSGQAIESPLFPGEPIRYHFGFYALVGLLERLGMRIDWAVNIPSALGFSALLILLYAVSFQLFANTRISWLTIIFFLFNGSLSGMQFLRDHPLSRTTALDIITNAKFPAFGPWDGGNISAFWTLNIYTNQRHLGLSYALLLAILLLLLKPIKKTWHIGFLIGGLESVLLFVNFAAAGISLLFLGWIFLIQKKSRMSLIISAIVALPAFFLVRHMSNTASTIVWQPGYLMRGTENISSFIRFWFANLGLHTFLIPLGVLSSPKAVRRLFAVPLMLLFLLPNLLRFSPDMINNHKFFNFFLIIGNMFSAFALIGMLKLYNTVKQPLWRNVLQCISGAVLITMLIGSGIIDFFPIINDTKGLVADIRANPDVQFIAKHTNPEDIIANSTWFYHPASIAGRPILSGYTYFTWSYGYDQAPREAILTSIYQADSVPSLCMIAQTNSVAFVELNEQPETYLRPNWTLWHSIIPVYENPISHLTLYSIADTCPEAGP